jgi:cytochrome c peroxidase
MHDGRFQHLKEVVAHYNRAPRVPFPEHTDIVPLGLAESEQDALIAFLRTLTSEISDPLGESLGEPAVVTRVPM